MKTTLILLLIALSCRAQNGLIPISDILHWKTIPIDTIWYQGYKTVNTFDTIYVQFLVTEKYGSAFVQFGKEVRQKQVYCGDRMPPGDYSDRWIHYKYLNIDTTLTIWSVQEWK